MKYIIIEIIDKFYQSEKSYTLINFIQNKYSTNFKIMKIDFQDKKYNITLLDKFKKAKENSVILCQIPFDIKSTKEINRLYYTLINNNTELTKENIHIFISNKYEDTLIYSNFLVRYSSENSIKLYLDKFLKLSKFNVVNEYTNNKTYMKFLFMIPLFVCLSKNIKNKL